MRRRMPARATMPVPRKSAAESSVVLRHPFGIGGCRFIESERMERNSLRQARCDAVREVGEQVLAGGLVGSGNDVAETPAERFDQRAGRFGRPQHERMVEPRDDLLVHDAFEHAEIHHHAAFGILRPLRRNAFHRYEQSVGVAVYLAARPVVPFEGVRRLERKFLGQSDYCHIRKDTQQRPNRKEKREFIRSAARRKRPPSEQRTTVGKSAGSGPHSARKVRGSYITMPV